MTDQSLMKKRFDRLKYELGPVVAEALTDPKCIEIMLNPDGKVWIERLGEPMAVAGELSPTAAESAMRSIASLTGKNIEATKPILECELPLDGSRFEGVLPPLSKRPAFTLRKKASLVFTLNDYLRQGVINEEVLAVLLEVVKRRHNLLIVGSTGSGKTTFANAMLDAIARLDPGTRAVIIEDTPELQCTVANKFELVSTHDVSMVQLLKVTMRLRPDRIIVGEVRDGSAHALLKAWGTGHPGGLGTVHADDAEGALIRLEQLIQEANVPPVPAAIAKAVNAVVVIEKCPGGRRIREVAEVKGYDRAEERYLLNYVYRAERSVMPAEISANAVYTATQN